MAEFLDLLSTRFSEHGPCVIAGAEVAVHIHTHTHTRVAPCDSRCVCFGLRVWEPLPRPIVVQVDSGHNSPPVRGLARGGLLVEFVNLL